MECIQPEGRLAQCGPGVDESKEDKLATATIPYRGLDNKHDILNTQLTVINGLQASLRRGELFRDKYQIISDIDASLFEDRFENLLTGWSMNVTLQVANDDMSLINDTGDACR